MVKGMGVSCGKVAVAARRLNHGFCRALAGLCLGGAALAVSFSALVTAVLPGSARAQGWATQIAGDANGPPLFIAIDKGAQQLLLFKQQSPLTLVDRFTCTTGENQGDKYEEGDLRTPEGVYFTEVRLDAGLDFDLYGDMAYTLNFPNPVDRIKGKTGSGIWIHGRGHPIVPRETKGCVALANMDLGRLEPSLQPGLPVIIADDVEWAEQAQDPEVSAQLVELVTQWAAAWQSRSETFFDFFDPVRFSQAHGSFADFRAHKENLFRNLPWIQVAVNDIRVIAGPDYWVTYFGQYYRSPTLLSEGIKRLYWMKDENGRFRIVGNEWVMAPLGLEQVIARQASDELTSVIEQWRQSWESGSIEQYLSFYAENASQDGRRGIDAIRRQKEQLWASGAPMHVGVENLDIQLNPQGYTVTFTQNYQAGDFSDRGMKTLVLESQGGQWRIVRETWRAM